MALKTAFAGAVLATAASTGVAADNTLSSNQENIQNLLNLQAENSFYIPGAGVRIDESCAATGGDTVCQMEIINGRDLRVLRAQVTYTADGQGNLIDISATPDKAKFYTPSGAGRRVGATTNTAEGNQYDKRLAEVSDQHRAATHQEAKDHGFDSPRAYIKSRLGEYKVEGGVRAAIGKELSQNEVFGSLELHDGITRVKNTGYNSFSETTCKLIPVAGADPTNYDIDVPESFRGLCVTRDFNLGANVTTTYTIHGLTDGGELQQTSFADTREMGSMPNGERGLQDHEHYEAVTEKLGDRPSTNMLSY